MLGALLPATTLEYLILPTLVLLVVATGRLLAGPLVRLPLSGWLERCILYALIGVVVLSWVGVVLACLSVFRWWLLAASLLPLMAWSLWRERRARMADAQIPSTDRTPALIQLGLVVLLVVAGWAYARPAETFLLTSDAAVYTIGGIVLARDGSLQHEPPSVYDVAAKRSDYWETSGHGDNKAGANLTMQFSVLETATPMLARHYGPFFQWSVFSHALEIGFLSLPKVWAAYSVWLFGQPYAVWPVCLFGLLGLAMLYALASRLFGPATGLGASLLLGVSLPQLWFSRLPISEAYVQVFLLGGLYLFWLARQETHPEALKQPLAVASALALMTLIVLRLEAVAFLAISVPLLVIGWGPLPWRQSVSWRTWLVGLATSGSVGLLLSLATSPAYFYTRVVPLLGLGSVRAALAGGTLLLVICGLLVAGRKLGDVVAWARRHSHHVIMIAWLLWGLIAVWSLFARPWSHSLPGWLAQYWTRPGLALSVMGAIWVLWDQRQEQPAPELSVLLGLTVAFLALSLGNALTNPVHPWAMRRLVQFVMPSLALCAAALVTKGADRAGDWLKRWSLPRGLGASHSVLAILVVLTLAFGIGQRTWPLLAHRERAGMWQQIETLAERFPQGSVLLFDYGQITVRLTPAMEMIFGFPSFLVRDTLVTRSDSPVTDGLIEAALAQGRQVFMIVHDGASKWRPDAWRLESQGLYRFDVPVLRSALGRPPNATDLARQIAYVDIYRVLPVAEIGAHSSRQTIQISAGAGSYPYLGDGFYPAETTAAGDWVRWTKDESEITLPWPAEQAADPADFCLRVNLSGWRPTGVPAPHLVITAEDAVLFDAKLDAAAPVTTLQLSAQGLPNRGLPALEIEFISDIWSPEAYSEGRDERQVGILFYGLEIEPGHACAAAPTTNQGSQ